MYVASIAAEDTTAMFTSAIAAWINESPTNRALTDLYDATSGEFVSFYIPKILSANDHSIATGLVPLNLQLVQSLAVSSACWLFLAPKTNNELRLFRKQALIFKPSTVTFTFWCKWAFANP